MSIENLVKDKHSKLNKQSGYDYFKLCKMTRYFQENPNELVISQKIAQNDKIKYREHDENIKFDNTILHLISKKYSLLSPYIFKISNELEIMKELEKNYKIREEDIIYINTQTVSKMFFNKKKNYLVVTKNMICYKNDENSERKYIKKMSINKLSTKNSILYYSEEILFDFGKNNIILSTQTYEFIRELLKLKEEEKIDYYKHTIYYESIDFRVAYLTFLAVVVAVDGDFYASEINYLYFYKKLFNVFDEDFLDIINSCRPIKYDKFKKFLDDFGEHIFENKLKYIFVHDLIVIAFSDNNFVKEEEELIKNIVLDLKIDIDIFRLMVNFMREIKNESKNKAKDVLNDLQERLKGYNDEIQELVLTNFDKMITDDHFKI